jgi:hypothetical protein
MGSSGPHKSFFDLLMGATVHGERVASAVRESQTTSSSDRQRAAGVFLIRSSALSFPPPNFLPVPLRSWGGSVQRFCVLIAVLSLVCV